MPPLCELTLAIWAAASGSRIRHAQAQPADQTTADEPIETTLNLTLASAQGYNEKDAARFASLSSAAYCDNLEAVLDWTCEACIDSKTSVVEDGIRLVDGSSSYATRVLVGKLKGAKGCVLAFRGTDNWANKWTDLDYWRRQPQLATWSNCPGCEVHEGFFAAWLDLKPGVLDAINVVGCGLGTEDSKYIYATGHSLGGAIAHLAMFSMKSSGFGFGTSYSFESPRVGNEAFASAFNNLFKDSKLWRITRHMDPVPHVPAKSWNFVHVNTEVHYDEHGSYTVCDDTENTTCSNKYSDLDLVTHMSEHCLSILVPNGNLCNPLKCAADSSHPPQCRTSGNKTCVFPFIYRGQTYDTCAPSSLWWGSWCATATDADKHFDIWRGEWGTCTHKCHVPQWECYTRFNPEEDRRWCKNAEHKHESGYHYRYTPKGGLCGLCSCCRRKTVSEVRLDNVTLLNNTIYAM